MKLADLLEPLDYHELTGDAATEISSLTCNSRQVRPGSLFFALPGVTADGHDYIAAAVEAGAAAVLLEDPSKAPSEIPWVRVADGRSAMAQLAAFFYGNPTSSRSLCFPDTRRHFCVSATRTYLAGWFPRKISLN
jgi:UDP-N-acetylmuramoyl-L-alanyl-D-glutamate--2,6-diaminopimelate ligase